MTDKKLDGLNLRRSLAQFCIRTLDQMPKETEGRASAMEEYKKQLASIDEKITKLTGTPPPIVVGLKTATLFGESQLS